MTIGCIFLLAARAGSAEPSPESFAIEFNLSMPQPAAHRYRVVLECDVAGDAEAVEFRMPVWTPGFYGTFDYAGNVRNLAAADGEGRALPWEKTATNGWRVRTGRAGKVAVTYDVLAMSPFVANAYLDAERGYVTPAALFLYIPGRLRRPVAVTIQPNPAWSTIATGLDPISPHRPHTYLASDFDVLYDSPILMGNLESLPPFEIDGVRHDFIGFGLGAFDRRQFMDDLRAVVEAGIGIIGDIPYQRYTFLAIGPGQGGIEHLNSAAFAFTHLGSPDRAARNRDLAFLAHEYFHNYNVKRIRPIALGPFDYDRPNITNMLWVSEGFTVYYEHLMLARSGRITGNEALDSLGGIIAAYEGGTGRLFQSATRSSAETWTQGPFGGDRGKGVRKTISYYEKGAILGWLLDIKIRHETRNRASLDTLMRDLYRTYYLELRRGWTDEEFHRACEKIAGPGVGEVLEHASNTEEIDYPKYLAHAGLQMEAPRELPEPFLGAIVEDAEDQTTVAAVEPRSPAAGAGLAAGDVIAAIDGAAVDARGLEAAIAAHRPGDRLRIAVTRAGGSRTIEVTLARKVERNYKILPMPRLDELQALILKSWTKRSVR